MTVRESLWDIPGQERAVEVLARASRAGEVGHAWAFLGPAGVGQEGAARALVATLVCASDDPPCGTCDACERAARGAHPAYFEFAPTGPFHRVADVRERWLPIASRSAGEGGWKILRIIDADRMNEAAANAFLKGLEEPPPRTVWLLDVADPDDLPDTILSRCRSVRFAALGPATLEEEARRLGLEDPADRALAARACLGSPRRLRALAAPGGLDDLRAHRAVPRGLRSQGFALVAAKQLDDEVARRTAAVKDEGKAEREWLAEGYGDAPPRAVVRELDERQHRREREARTAVVQDALDDIASWYRDVLLVSAGAAEGQLVGADEAAALREEADALSADKALRALDLVMATRANLERNVGVRLALEALFMDLSALYLRS